MKTYDIIKSYEAHTPSGGTNLNFYKVEIFSDNSTFGYRVYKLDSLSHFTKTRNLPNELYLRSIAFQFGIETRESAEDEAKGYLK